MPKKQEVSEQPKDFGTSEQPMTKDEYTASTKSEKPKVKKSEWTVYKNAYPVRTYSLDVHGDNAEELAAEFCAHSGDEVR